ncbi:MAG: DNA polymerase IV [Anaerolineales bacterium]|jgi:DNA polymerase-4
MPEDKDPRRIIHLDLDAFFCSVEENRDPELRGLPFAVGGSPDGRGVVASCSYAARRFGVHSAMPMARALVLCPQLIVIRHHFEDYKRASRQVMDRLHAVSPLVEQVSIDEAFLDVSQVKKSTKSLVKMLQSSIREELELPYSIGVATNKLVAKIANNVGKSEVKGLGPPNAITIVQAGDEANFLAPLHVEMLWGVGPKTALRLADLGIETIGDLARTPEDHLMERFGKIGWHLSQRAKGIDNRPIVTHHGTKSISSETTFAKDIHEQEKLLKTLQKLSGRVSRRLQKQNLSGKTIKIKIRWPDFTTLTRQTSITQHTNDEGVIYELSRRLFESEWEARRPVRLLGVGVSGLTDQPRQLGLWDEDVLKEVRLQDTLADLKHRFGEQALTRGFQE